MLVKLLLCLASYILACCLLQKQPIFTTSSIFKSSFFNYPPPNIHSLHVTPTSPQTSSPGYYLWLCAIVYLYLCAWYVYLYIYIYILGHVTGRILSLYQSLSLCLSLLHFCSTASFYFNTILWIRISFSNLYPRLKLKYIVTLYHDFENLFL